MLNKFKNLFKEKPMEILAAVSGTLVPLNTVSDPAFADGIIGQGIAIEPREGKIFAPVDGKILGIFKTNHAITILSDFGAEILIHIGIDTVNLGGQHFTPHVKKGDEIKKGDLLVTFDVEAIKDAGYDLITPILVCNMEEFGSLQPSDSGEVDVQDLVMTITKK